MSDNPISFMRRFPLTPETVCTEAPFAWLALQGRVARVASTQTQRGVYRRHGFNKGLILGCRMVGLEIIEDVAIDGDVVIAAQNDAQAFVGVLAPGGLTVAASFGALIVARLPILRVIRENSPCRL